MNEYMEFYLSSDERLLLDDLKSNEFEDYCFSKDVEQHRALTEAQAIMYSGVIAAGAATLVPIVQELINRLFKKTSQFKINFICNESNNSYQIEITLATYDPKKVEAEIEKLKEACKNKT